MLMHLLLRGYLYSHGNKPPCGRRRIRPAIQINYDIIPAAGLAVSQRPRKA